MEKAAAQPKCPVKLHVTLVMSSKIKSGAGANTTVQFWFIVLKRRCEIEDERWISQIKLKQYSTLLSMEFIHESAPHSPRPTGERYFLNYISLSVLTMRHDFVMHLSEFKRERQFVLLI